MNKCGDCIRYRVSCPFTEFLEEIDLSGYVACGDFFPQKDYDKGMEKAIQITDSGEEE